MPRESRKVSESKIYHVMIRGNERKPIFIDNADRSRYIQLLCDKNKTKQYSIYAYCLMDNHVHLLLNEGNDQISRIMQRINVSYAYYFNKKYGRIGHLFQDRFKSEAIEDDAYLAAAVRYIHNNPVKANLATHPGEYNWSSYSLYLNNALGDTEPIDTTLVLSIFSNERKTALESFEKYSKQDSTDHFIEYQGDRDADKPLWNEMDTKAVISEYLSNKSLSLDDMKKPINRKLLHELIVQLKGESNLSMRQIAILLDVDRNIVQRNR